MGYANLNRYIPPYIQFSTSKNGSKQLP